MADAGGWRRKPALRPGALLIQGAVVLAIALFAITVSKNVAANMARLDVKTGFDFLWRGAGFDIALKLIPYTEQSTYFRAFLVALLNTVAVALVAAILATILGFLVGFARLSRSPVLSGLAGVYVDVVRNVPLLLQLFYWYFAVLGALPAARQSMDLFGVAFLNKRGLVVPAPVATQASAVSAALLIAGALCAWMSERHARRHRIETGQPWKWRLAAPACALVALGVETLVEGWPLRWDIPELRGFNFSGGVSLIPEMVAMIVALSVFSAAFIAELVRAAVLSVPKGQTEAALALGLSRWRIGVAIVVPQAMRALVPPLTGEYIHLLKNSSLGAAIAFPDLMLVVAGTTLNQTGQPLEVMFMTMAAYLALCLLISSLGNLVNRRYQLVER